MRKGIKDDQDSVRSDSIKIGHKTLAGKWVKI